MLTQREAEVTAQWCALEERLHALQHDLDRERMQRTEAAQEAAELRVRSLGHEDCRERGRGRDQNKPAKGCASCGVRGWDVLQRHTMCTSRGPGHGMWHRLCGGHLLPL